MSQSNFNIDAVENAIEQLEGIRSGSGTSDIDECLAELRRARRALRSTTVEPLTISPSVIGVLELLQDIEESSLGTPGARSLRSRASAGSRRTIAKHRALLEPAVGANSMEMGSKRYRKGSPYDRLITTTDMDGVITVEAGLIIRLLGEEEFRMPATLTYRSSDPYAILMCVNPGTENVTWTFGRSLIYEGIRKVAGTGDVKIWPGFKIPERASSRGGQAGFEVPSSLREMRRAPNLYVSLSSPEGDALLCLDRNAVKAFLRRTQTVVSIGSESSILNSANSEEIILDHLNRQPPSAQ
ncbi:hypothetical protein Kpho02_67790 [Kitasatospora phosalacinea]|uniref:SsgA n=1 Tax=Kitasatospora phosalacinea TaxID=2065 RepID=A0A9W6QGD5_9ACTN|nr:SsgA family sporulation/cell division regulator [Kitasatospora phosalacinea]GLW74481.1 hypothetical protein Kpho02_67790 [Kitasatospora phosalacinea]